jgi:hypothetical protein
MLLRINQVKYWRFQYKTREHYNYFTINIGSEIIYKNIKNGKQQSMGLVDQ